MCTSGRCGFLLFVCTIYNKSVFWRLRILTITTVSIITSLINNFPNETCHYHILNLCLALYFSHWIIFIATILISSRLSLSLVTGRWFNNLPPSNPSRYNIGRIYRFSCCINPETILIGFHEHLQINLNLPTDVCLIALITRKSRLSFYECELVDQATVWHFTPSFTEFSPLSCL